MTSLITQDTSRQTAFRRPLKLFLARLGLFTLLSLSLTFTPLAQAKISENLNSAPETLLPAKHHTQTTVSIVKRLHQLHYRERKLNDVMSSEIFDRYIKELDRNRSYFLATDIEEFERYRYQMDEALKRGNMFPAFEIFNRYQQRLTERLRFLLDYIHTGAITKMKFESEESLMLEREDALWWKEVNEQNEYWRKRLKNRVLSLKLAGKTLEEAEEVLQKRYRNQLNRAHQTKADDAYQLFINSFTQIYDPHTQYFSPRTSENFNINMSLQLEGIGAVLQSEDEFTKVVRLVAGGPADKAKNLSPADRIVGVGQGKKEVIDVVGWRLDEVVQLIRGPKGTNVRLEIIPATEANDQNTEIITITRNTVKLEDRAAQKRVIEIDHEGKPVKLGVIEVPTFYADFRGIQEGKPNYRSTTRDVKRLISELEKEGVEGLVIDLRNNGGGSLQEANSLVGLFIETGPTVQVRNANDKIDLLGDPDPEVVYHGPLAVLVNRLSASASEIFAGAIQDYQRGLIIGGRTFGKGTVQSLQNLDRGQLKITLAKFYRISGESNQHQGILPDIIFPSVYDENEIGESSLPNALPADSIRPARYQQANKITPVLSHLRSKHFDRIKGDPDFKYLQDQIAFLEESRSKKAVTLNEKQRRNERTEVEQTRLSIENARRKAKGMKPFKDYTELKAANGEDEEENVEAKEEDEEKPLEDDFVLSESAHILKDLIEMPRPQIAVK